MHDFKGKDILDGAQFTRDEIEIIMDAAEDMRLRLEESRVLDLMKEYILATLFFEPSTRTRLSFETAMHRLGGEVVGFASAGTTSSAKGESLTDTIRTVDQYAAVIVIRHPEIGSAKVAAEVATAPVINGGDGAGQHPTQALLDLFTIRSERGHLDDITIVLCGDLKYGRTVHAGVELYKHYDCSLILVAPDQLSMPHEITARLREGGVKVEETTDLESALKKADVLYMTRIQKERLEDPARYERLKSRYILTREMVEQIRPEVTILHPLPRVNEITTDVDSLPGAAYFRQVKNGIYIRMALIALVTGRI
ncbi:MAG: aspartate carbamoyltransferase [Anaerolineales bacterium]|nr:MAG: aspartate carbamoyltransferase [Anaerolineales bacterium]